MNEIIIRRGDSYAIPFGAILNNQALPKHLIRNVEITIGELVKTFNDGIYYKDYALYFPLTEEDTYGFIASSTMKSQVRLQLNPNGDIISLDGPTFKVIESLSSGRISNKIRIK